VDEFRLNSFKADAHNSEKYFTFAQFMSRDFPVTAERFV